MKRLVHELQTHKVELELQNEELRRAEYRLKQAAKRYGDLYDFAPVGYLTVTRHGVIREINMKGAACLQRDRIQLIGAPFQSFIYEGYREVFNQHIFNLVQKGERQSCKLRLKNDQTEPFYALLESVVWNDKETGEQFFRIALNDISGQVRSEAELIEARDKAEQANFAKSLFLANMSHEIRTPLAVIMGYSELLEVEANHEASIQAPVSAIKRNGTHLLEVIDDILDISRIESGKLTVSLTAFKAIELIQDVVDGLKPKAEAKGLTLELEKLNDIPEIILTDATRLRQIIINILNNAIKFTRQGKVALKVSHEASGDSGSAAMLQVDVADTGCGIPMRSQHTLFKPFSQVDPTNSREFSGLGLGLYLSQKLAQALGGDVTLLESHSGVGSTFRIHTSMRVIAKEQILATPLTPQKIEHTELKGITILLVEDSPDIQLVIRNMIEMAGGTVYCADDGVHAISMAMEKPIDLILMDLQLPLLDGYKATAELRKNHFTKPVLALTAHAFHEERQRVLLSTDFDGFLTKPIGFKPLVENLKKWIGRESTHAIHPPSVLH